ncbi:hypothetical protein BUE80_DR002324 [Diplocarpon rosae]|nr:hypothetical protein BUE80_DR002324 [Diplocarpon rosae]
MQFSVFFTSTATATVVTVSNANSLFVTPPTWWTVTYAAAMRRSMNAPSPLST